MDGFLISYSRDDRWARSHELPLPLPLPLPTPTFGTRTTKYVITVMNGRRGQYLSVHTCMVCHQDPQNHSTASIRQGDAVQMSGDLAARWRTLDKPPPSPAVWHSKLVNWIFEINAKFLSSERLG